MLATPGNRTRASAVGIQCHKHHATHYYCAENYYFLYGYTG